MREAIEHWLGRHSALAAGTTLGAVLLRHGDSLRLAAAWPAGLTPDAALVAAGRAALEADAAVLRPEAGGGGCIAHPLAAGEAAVGVVVLRLAAMPPAGSPLPEALARHARQFSSLLPGHDPAAQVLRIVQHAFDQPRFEDGCVALLGTLAATVGADRASLGLREGGRTRVVATSVGGEVDARGAAEADLAAAMDEVIDDAASLCFPQPPGDGPRIVAAHARLAKAQALSGLCSVPLVSGGALVGAIVLERTAPPAGQPAAAVGFERAEQALVESVARLAAAWIDARRAAARPWHQRLRRAWRDGRDHLARPGHGRWKLAAAALGVGAVLLLAVPTRQQLSANARLEGQLQRALTAPGDGFLRQVWVRPGDLVQAGQPLVEFAGDELQLERQKLAAELAGEESALGDALAREDRARLAVAGARVEELRAQIALLDQRLERCQVLAPFDGVVIEGDLSRSLGAPMKRGEALLTLAPRKGFRAIVEVPDSDIALVRDGQAASLVLTAQPGRALPARVRRITPMATQVDGRNVFEVEVALESAAAADELRPGMRGVARLEVGASPVAVAWSRDALAWLRLAAWRWIG